MTQIRVERTLAAPPERVYAAWTDPALLGRWFCPNPDLALAVTADAVVGGRYRVDMGEGRFVAEGEYTALEPSRLVAFTWRWTTSDDPASEVRVELAPAGPGTPGGTRLVLVHSGLVDDDDARGHGEGWALQLDRLEGVA
jgi:uncharacterized protein YndB with AHSA1/START domain